RSANSQLSSGDGGLSGVSGFQRNRPQECADCVLSARLFPPPPTFRNLKFSAIERTLQFACLSTTRESREPSLLDDHISSEQHSPANEEVRAGNSATQPRIKTVSMLEPDFDPAPTTVRIHRCKYVMRDVKSAD